MFDSQAGPVVLIDMPRCYGGVYTGCASASINQDQGVRRKGGTAICAADRCGVVVSVINGPLEKIVKCWPLGWDISSFLSLAILGAQSSLSLRCHCVHPPAHPTARAARAGTVSAQIGRTSASAKRAAATDSAKNKRARKALASRCLRTRPSRARTTP